MRLKSSLPSALISVAFCASFSCRHPYATARSSAINVVGVARIIFCSTPHSIRLESLSSAALKKHSPGKNRTANSGAWSNWSPIRFARQRRHVSAYLTRVSARRALRVTSSGASMACR